MAPSMDINIAMEDIKMEKKKRKKSKNLTDAVEEVNAEDSDEASKKKKKKKKKDSCSIAVVGKEEEATLIQMIAKYLDKRKLHKTLSSFLSETQCESSWKIQVMDLEDIFNQYSNRYSENLKKHNIENREDHVNQHNILKLQEPEVQRKYVNNVVNSKGTLSMSGALKQQVPRSDKSDGSCDDTQEGISKSKNKKHKGPRKDICLDSDKTPKQTDSGKFDKSLQESLEVPKEKKKKKKMSEDNNLIDNDEHKTSTDNGNENFSKGNRKPSKQTDSGKRDKSFQESLEVQKEEKKKKNSDDKDLIDNDEQETSVDKEIGNSIKDNSKPSETSLKQRDSEKLDKSLQESQEAPKEKKKKKKSFEDEDSIKNVDEKSVTNNKDENLTKDNSKPSKSSKKSKHNLQLDESLHGSVEVPKEKRKKENAEEKDSGDHDKQNNAKKIKKGKKEFNNKLQSSSSNVINEETIEGNVKNLSEDTDKLLDDTTPGQKGFKADKDQTNISSNSKQKSGEPTSAKAFQRVKLEEVEFVDPRLQDNSYWAKSGAEIGYGAKAEEVLGQVRGRDFRHEKTKKKRGSYKGGMIDLQSHSIKFSYSDEE